MMRLSIDGGKNYIEGKDLDKHSSLINYFIDLIVLNMDPDTKAEATQISNDRMWEAYFKGEDIYSEFSNCIDYLKIYLQIAKNDLIIKGSHYIPVF